jgi:hypothetical protein
VVCPHLSQGWDHIRTDPVYFPLFCVTRVEATPLEYVADLLSQLPKDHIALLKCLLKLLHRVSSEETSKMSAHNLGTHPCRRLVNTLDGRERASASTLFLSLYVSAAVCIGPNILRLTDNVSLEASLEASHSIYAVCAILIEKAYTLFPVR